MAFGHLRSVTGRSAAAGPAARRRSLSDALVAQGVLAPSDADCARKRAKQYAISIQSVFLARKMVAAKDIAQTHAALSGAEVVDLMVQPPDPRLIDRLGANDCLKLDVLPWRQVGKSVVVVTDRPEALEQVRARLEACFGHVILAIATKEEMTQAIVSIRGNKLVQLAENRVPINESCRNIRITGKPWLGVLLIGGLGALIWFAPEVLFIVLCAWAVLTLVLNTILKTAAGYLHLRSRNVARPDAMPPCLTRQPVVSVLVPLYKEREIASHLVTRLRRVKYPRELLDIILVTEADDLMTRDTLSQTRLPSWIRTVTVPSGTIKTKPRALNYALDHCRGSIIGIYDAEDAPDPHQIRDIVRRFSERATEVVCLQGILDFYNAKTNWLSRCFAIEYATWFRVVLPGLDKMGLVFPLGGTTLFFRREGLEKMGAWDAHNVTEDADLGVRLARHGYRAELVETVTAEEANCRAWPWIKQRSRWLKGYAMTYAVHMRNPLQLFHELGLWRFFGIQLLFLGTLSQFILAPVLWSFWLVPLGLPHPLVGLAPTWLFWTLGGTFLTSEILAVLVSMLAVSGPAHKHLRKWVPTLHFYFPLGALASYKAVLELFTKPFYWDKTAHGVAGKSEPTPQRPASAE